MRDGDLDNAKGTGKAASAVMAAGVLGSTLMKVVMAGALAQIWGMINGLQVLVHLPCMAAQIPQAQLSIVSEVIKVATFDIPYVEMGSLA